MAKKQKGLFKKIMSSFLSVSCALSMAAVGSTLSSTTANAAITPSSGDASTFSWDNATVYFLLIDRFKNGDTSNDNAYGRQNIKLNDQRATMHGGDFAGITEKINDGYFTDLGVNAIWLTAPYEQIHGYIQGGSGFYHYSYHGYYVLDYTETDAAFGTKEEFRTLVDAAHSKGIRIIMDIVMNHSGYGSMYDMNEYNFGGLKSGWDTFYNNPDENNTDLYHSYIDYEGSADGWARWWYKWVRAGLPGYPEPGSSEQTRTLDGLPDFRTDSSEQVGIPTFLQTKWTKEGTLAAKTSKYGSSNTVLGYITSFLSEWVREYGVDGFRCDTAKHVNPGEWKVLKDKCVEALKEWKQKNPTKKLDDLDFWMTGEHWDWNIGYGKDAYFTQGGFNSMINFETQGGGLLASGKVADTYQRYADKINTDPDFNVLSYISSHDSTLTRTGDMYYMGSAFLLMPGAVQIYYGDESARPFVPGVPQNTAGHAYRSDMNWGENQDLVKHWGIVGRFRNSHVAVGAGANIGLTASSGIAFARTFDKNGITDKIAAVINASGSVSVDVSAIWSNGTTLENAYDGTTAVVTGGKVTFSAGAHGTILIQEPDGERGMVTVQHINQDTGAVIKTDMVSGLVGESYSVSADAELTKTYDLVKTEGKTTGTFSADGATVKFYYHLDTSKFGTITITHIDAATGDSIADSQTITGKVGESYSAQPVDVKNYEVDLSASTNTSGTFKSGTDIKVVFKYNFVEPTGLTVHYYNTSWSKVNIYAYDKAETKQYAGAWPGTAMTNDGNGWWSYNFSDIEDALVIFNDTGTSQEPARMQPGYTVSGEVWLKDGVAASAGKVKVVYSGTDGKTLGTATLTGLEGESYTTSAKEFSGYTLTGTPSNATGKYTSSTITVTYTYKPDVVPVDELVNNSTLSVTSIKLGSSVTATGAATGGTKPYQYQVVYKLSTASSWTTAKAYNSTASVTFKPSAGGTYSVCIKVKDADNTEVKKFFTLKVEASALVNNSTVSPTKVTLGNNVTVKCAASGGSGSYKYAVFYKASSASTWTTKQDFSSTSSVSIKFTGTGTKNICIKVKDGAGTIVKKYIDVVVEKGLTNTSKLSASTITLGSTAKAVCSATGGTGYYNYAVFYKKTSDTSWATAQNYSSNDTVTFKPAKATTYDVCLKVKDTNGTESKKYVTLTVKAAELVNTSTVSPTSVTLGNNVTVKCSATGGAGSYKYAVFYKASSASTWTTKQDFSATSSVAIKFAGAGTKNICVKVKDANGTITKKYFDVTVKANALANTSTVSATSVVKGKAVVVTASATGGSGSYQYAVYYKKASATSWTEKQAFGTNTKVSMTYPSAEVYDICVKVKDSKGTVVKKYFSVSINTATTNLKNNSTVSATSVTKGTKVTVKGAASGATDSVLYQYAYKNESASNYTVIKNYSSTTSVSFTPSEAGNYTVRVIAQDMKPSTAVKTFYVTVK